MAGLLEMLNDSDDELPPNWEERVTDDGRIYFANHDTQDTQWEHPVSGERKRVPSELPYGWVMRTDADGLQYFEDTINKRLTTADPRLAFKRYDHSHHHGSQTPLYQRFTARSTAYEVVRGRDLSNVYAIVTGSNCGIGFATAKALATQGAHVALTSTSLERAQLACKKLRSELPLADVEPFQLQLDSIDGVRSFCRAYKASGRKLNLLIMNAGVFGLPYALSEDQVEMQFRINHLGHFHLFGELKDLLVSSRPSRVVVVSSESHRFSSISEKELPSSVSELRAILNCPAKNYSSLMAYNHSKLCNVLFSRELHRRYRQQGISSNCLHPGNLVFTQISRHWWLWRLLFLFSRPFTKTVDQAAATTVYCSVEPDLEGIGGFYFNNCSQCAPSEPAFSIDLAKTLWQLSETMVKELSARFGSAHCRVDVTEQVDFESSRPQDAGGKEKPASSADSGSGAGGDGGADSVSPAGSWEVLGSEARTQTAS